MNRTLFFFNFVFCECFARDPIGYAYTGGSVRRPHLTYGQRNFCTHFFDVATKPLLSEFYQSILTRAGPKTFRKKCKKTRPGVSPEQRSPRQDKKSRMCVTCKLRDPRNNSHRKWQQESDLARPAPTCPIRSLHFEQNAFFCKKLDFSDYQW